MAKINPHYSEVAQIYFFSEIARRAKAFTDSHAGVELMKLGIGNTTQPIVPSIISGLEFGVRKLSDRKTYTGYGDEQGDVRLRRAIAQFYANRGISIAVDEVFVSDGAKSDCAAANSQRSPRRILSSIIRSRENGRWPKDR